MKNCIVGMSTMICVWSCKVLWDGASEVLLCEGVNVCSCLTACDICTVISIATVSFYLANFLALVSVI